MKKGTKLFSAVLMAFMMLGTVAFASTGDYYFFFTPGTRASSDNLSKSDGEQTAYVTTTLSNLVPRSLPMYLYRGSNGVYGRVWYRVRHTNDTFASEVKSITECSSITLNYLHDVNANEIFYLKGQQDSADPAPVKVNGRWTP